MSSTHVKWASCDVLWHDFTFMRLRRKENSEKSVAFFCQNNQTSSFISKKDLFLLVGEQPVVEETINEHRIGGNPRRTCRPSRTLSCRLCSPPTLSNHVSRSARSPIAREICLCSLKSPGELSEREHRYRTDSWRPSSR